MADTDNRVVVGALVLDIQYSRKYDFDTGAATKMEAILVAVPPPGLLLEALQTTVSRRAQRAAAVQPEE